MLVDSTSNDFPPLQQLLALFKNRWTPPVLLALSPDAGDAITPRLRRREIKKKLPYLSDRVLTDALRDLEGQKLIERRVLGLVPQGVEYWLTPAGCLFVEPFRALEAWCEQHQRELERP